MSDSFSDALSELEAIISSGKVPKPVPVEAPRAEGLAYGRVPYAPVSFNYDFKKTCDSEVMTIGRPPGFHQHSAECGVKIDRRRGTVVRTGFSIYSSKMNSSGSAALMKVIVDVEFAVIRDLLGDRKYIVDVPSSIVARTHYAPQGHPFKERVVMRDVVHVGVYNFLAVRLGIRMDRDRYVFLTANEENEGESWGYWL